jgi:hypothetical protein
MVDVVHTVVRPVGALGAHAEPPDRQHRVGERRLHALTEEEPDRRTADRARDDAATVLAAGIRLSRWVWGARSRVCERLHRQHRRRATMSDAEHPIDMLDDAPEADAVEQGQTADDAGPVTSTTAADTATAADGAEQRTGAGDDTAR